MRRDIFIGLTVSLLVHASFAIFKPAFVQIIKVPSLPEKKIIFIQPPLEPEKSEPIDSTEEKPLPDMAPPMQQDAPALVKPDTFVQPLRPPAPENLNPSSTITIPVNPRIGPKGDPNEIFDPSKLDQQPAASYQAKPVYPFEMRHGGINGKVVVGFVVDAAGNVKDVYAVSSTQREFESAAIQAVSKWKFKPGRRGGAAVATRMQVPMVFSISEEP